MHRQRLMKGPITRPVPAAVIVLGLLFGSLVSLAHAERPISIEPSATATVHRNIEYRSKETGELLPFANLLDVYVPQGRQEYPVILLIHGGAWIAGDKTLDFIPIVAKKFAEQGFGVVAANYRLSPLVRHPAHIQDVAKAVAWTVKNMPGYGGRKDEVLLVGHSAGGHLVTLATTDTQYLRAVGVAPEVIRGVVSVSGVYQISDLTLNGVAPSLGLTAATAVNASPFALAFGSDSNVWQQASPITHIRKGLPPFLLITASYDLPLLAPMAQAFHAKLKENGVETNLINAAGRGHATNFWRMAVDDDATFKSIMEFLKAQSGL